MARERRKDWLFGMITTGQTSQFDEQAQRRREEGMRMSEISRISEAHALKVMCQLGFVYSCQIVSDKPANKPLKDLEVRLRESSYLRHFNEKLLIPGHKFWIQVKSSDEHVLHFVHETTATAYGQELEGEEALQYLRIAAVNGNEYVSDSTISNSVIEQLAKINSFWRKVR